MDSDEAENINPQGTQPPGPSSSMSQIRFLLLEVPVITSPEAGTFLGDAYSFQDLPELLLVVTRSITRVR